MSEHDFQDFGVSSVERLRDCRDCESRCKDFLMIEG